MIENYGNVRAVLNELRLALKNLRENGEMTRSFSLNFSLRNPLLHRRLCLVFLQKDLEHCPGIIIKLFVTIYAEENIRQHAVRF